MRNIPGEFLAIDRKSRARVPSMDISNRPVEERVLDFDDVVIPLDPIQARIEAARCVQCPDPSAVYAGVPRAQRHPLRHVADRKRDVPGSVRPVPLDQLHARSLRASLPHEQLCQGSCSLRKSNDPVLTGALEAFVADYERATVGVQVTRGKPTGKKVAIVGSGPAGLTCAEQLAPLGHEVVVFESKPAPGGLLTYGIPNFKLPKQVVLNRVGDLEAAGVNFIYNTTIGKEKKIDDLFGEGFDAIFVGVGSEIDAPMEAPGEDLAGVYKATEFLMRANAPLEILPPKCPPARKSAARWS